MTDQPRFRIVGGDLDERHRHYYGGAQVDLFFKLIDTWRTGKWRSATSRAAILRPHVEAMDTTERFSKTKAQREARYQQDNTWMA